MGLCLSYTQTMRQLEAIARATERTQDFKSGTWLVAYDNINIFKHLAHTRTDKKKKDQMWKMTSRLAVAVQNLNPRELEETAHIPQCSTVFNRYLAIRQ